MGKSEYERYRLDGDLLWRECGTIEKNAEDIPNEGRVAVSQVGKVWLLTKEKDAQVVSNDRLNTLREKISGVLQQFRTVDDAPKLPSPEAYDRFAGAGLFELKVVDGDSQTIVLTSLDAVAERTPKPLTSVHELFAQLRGTESTSCRARDFFGIGRSN